MLQQPVRLPDRIAQLIFPRIGSNLPPGLSAETFENSVSDLLDRYALGGLVLFNADRFRSPHTLLRLQTRARFPLLIASDIERGAGQQIRGATVFPHALAFEALGESGAEYAEQAARITAREALASGLHIGLGPVADIHSNASNPIISLRAFGTTAESAGRLAAAWIRGSRKEGLLTCAKHFPGHGHTAGDSHDSLPTVDASIDVLKNRELLPFQEAIQAGADLMMTAHVAYPALDDRNRPATASAPILQTLLRGDMGFRGAVMSDSLLMEGIRDADTDKNPTGTGKASDEHRADDMSTGGAGAQAAELLRAGVDILLDVSEVDEVVDYLTTAIRSGQLDESIIDDAFDRVWALKVRLAARFGPGVFIDPGLAAHPSEIGSESNREVAHRIALKAISRLAGRPEQSALGQIDADTGDGLLGITVVANARHADPTGSTFQDVGPGRWPDATWKFVSPDTSLKERDELLDLAAKHACVLVGVVIKPAAWHAYGLPDDLAELTEKLLSNRGSILSCMGPSSISDRFTGASLTLGAHSDVRPSFNAVIRHLRTMASTVSGGLAPQLSNPLP